MSDMKVFGGTMGGKRRAIIAAKTQAEALKHLKRVAPNVTLYEMRNYWAETFNAGEIELALSRPGVLFVRSLDDPDQWSVKE